MSFIKSENGAVTVDWVVLTAALVGLGLAVMAVISGGVEDLSSDIDGQLENDFIIRTSFGCQAGEPGCNYFFPPEPAAECGEGEMDCGVNFFPWIAGSYMSEDGTSYAINSDGALIDPDNGDLLPTYMNAGMDEEGNFYAEGPFDMAGRLVDANGVPIEG